MAVTNEEYTNIELTDVMTGDRDKNRFLLYQLKYCIVKAESIDIIVSFLMESGVRMLIRDLKAALDRGVKLRLLTGNYLGITQPSALYLIKNELGDKIDLRFYNEKDRSFHPKAYIFHYKESNDIFIGSSNVSRSALTSGIEWNYRFSDQTDKHNYTMFYQTFVDLFYNHSIMIDDNELIRYSKNWKKPAVTKDLQKYDESEEKVAQVEPIFQPRGAQIEALYALKNSREEGAAKALIYAATGIGKTYLAAFDSLNYNTVLFVAHREEILNQAAVSFQNVRHSDDYGFFDGNRKETDKSVIFASVSTLGRKNYLTEEYFKQDYFELVIIDECHHMCADQYKRILNYFKPRFLLGLTATPDRMDGKNIYEICDYNVPYQITLKDAINKGMLVPFHYYGIFDGTTDYSGLHLYKGSYREEDLNNKYLHNERRYDLIYKYYTKYCSQRALGFCCSRAHAEDMAKEFCRRGIPSVAVYSNADGQFSENRNAAVSKLIKGEIKVIFSVDIFNEGVDIPTVDMVLFLRPTESPIVFLQQLGRGLRQSKNKEYLNVLDFIGNYEKAGRAPYLLSGQIYESGHVCRADEKNFEYPDDCIVDFDMRLIDLFQELEKRNMTIRDYIQEEYLKVREYLGKVPTRMELFTYMEDSVYDLCMKYSKDNPFRRYLDYLSDMGELGENEKNVYQGIGREFLHLLETTSMTKVYKMPILMAFYNDGRIKMDLTDDDILKYWKRFFSSGMNWKDLGSICSYEDYKQISDSQHLSNAKKNPIKYLKKSGEGFFVDKEGYAISMREELAEWIDNEAFQKHMKDIIEYRVMDYYKRRYQGKERA